MFSKKDGGYTIHVRNFMWTFPYHHFELLDKWTWNYSWRSLSPIQIYDDVHRLKWIENEPTRNTKSNEPKENLGANFRVLSNFELTEFVGNLQIVQSFVLLVLYYN